MTDRELREIERALPRCACGGRLCIKPPDPKRPEEHLTHLVFKCKKCGAWKGGLTYKYKQKGEARK